MVQEAALGPGATVRHPLASSSPQQLLRHALPFLHTPVELLAQELLPTVRADEDEPRQNRRASRAEDMNDENDSSAVDGGRYSPNASSALQKWTWKAGVEPPPFTTDNAEAIQFVLALSTSAVEVPAGIGVSKAVAIQVYVIFQHKALKHLPFKSSGSAQRGSRRSHSRRGGGRAAPASPGSATKRTRATSSPSSRAVPRVKERASTTLRIRSRRRSDGAQAPHARGSAGRASAYQWREVSASSAAGSAVCRCGCSLCLTRVQSLVVNHLHLVCLHE